MKQSSIVSFFKPKRPRVGNSTVDDSGQAASCPDLSICNDLYPTDGESPLPEFSSSQLNSISSGDLEVMSQVSTVCMASNDCRKRNVTISDLGKEEDGPMQPRIDFPLSSFGVKQPSMRGFNADWYVNRPWLEYSKSLDRAFCFPCRHFGLSRNTDEAFVAVGFKNWKNATINLGNHAKSTSHVASMGRWCDFETAQKQGSAFELVRKQSEEEESEFRRYLKVILDCLLFLAKEELPLR